MTLAAATVLPSHDGVATGQGCKEEDLPTWPWNLIYAAHTDNSLGWAGNYIL